MEDSRLAVRKIILPYFRGEDPFSWVSRAEAYFAIQDTPPELHLEFAQICMEGPPWHWFKILKEEDLCLNWKKFKRALFDRYGINFLEICLYNLKCCDRNGRLMNL